MTKRHFEQMARIVRAQAEYSDGTEAREAIRRVALKFADLCAAENVRFDRQRFYEACGLTNIGTGFAL